MICCLAAFAAVVASRSPRVRRLDERVLGQRRVAVVAVVAAALLLAATVATAVHSVWPVAALYALMTCWVGYWAIRRARTLRVE